MSKIKIKAILKTKNEKHIYKGKAIKNNNIIKYNDDGVITKITIEDIITIERKQEYYIKIRLKEGIKLEGKYITKYGAFKISTIAKKIQKDEKHLKIKYNLEIDDNFIGTYEYNFEYSIDS